MKKSIAAILLGLFVFTGCGGGGGATTGLAAEMAARKLAQKAAVLDKNHLYHESAELYKEIVEKYEKTKYYAELEKELRGKGISITTPLVSRTSQIMFRFQGIVLKYRRKNGYYPKAHTIKVPKDVWGNPLFLHVPTKEGITYEFLIFSKGPDKRAKTDDDVVIVYTKPIADDATAFGDTASKKELGGDQKSRKGSVSLRELKKMARKQKGKKSTGKTVSLDKIKSNKKVRRQKKKKAPVKKETVKSLDQLLAE